MHSPAEPDPLRSCPGRPGPPSPARVEHAFDGLRFGVSRDMRVRAYPIYAPISPIASASLARPYRVSSACPARLYRVAYHSPITRPHSPSLAYHSPIGGVTVG